MGKPVGKETIRKVCNQVNVKYVSKEKLPVEIRKYIETFTVTPVTTNISSVCTITGSANNGKGQTIIYTNSTSSDHTITVPTTYKTPDGAAIELTCPPGGYCEVSYINVNGVIYARGL